MLKVAAISLLALACAACGRPADAPSDGGPPVPPDRISDLERTLRSVPPVKREDLQRAIACENKRRSANGDRRLQMTADGVRGMLDRLSQDPSAAHC